MSKPSSSSKKLTTKQAYTEFGTLLTANLSKLTTGVDYVPDSVFTKIAEKQQGMTVGKVVRGQEEKVFLLKKSGRIRAEDEEEEDMKSRDLDAKGFTRMAAASFNEKCAATLFSIIKGQANYVPNMMLVRSEFDTTKPHNKLKVGSGAAKIYVASEIIGDAAAVNTESSHNARIFDTRRGSTHPEQLPDLTRDLGENAVIMFLLSNYDVKLDNFIHRDLSLIPIDFGNARAEEPLSPDFLDGADMIRRIGGEHSSKFASKDLRDRLSVDDGYKNTQALFKRILKPEHFLSVIAKIEANPGIENQLRNAALKWTFGTEEEKMDYADVLVARVRNLVMLKPMLERMNTAEQTTQGNFAKKPLRSSLANSPEFVAALVNQSNTAGSAQFYRFITAILDEIVVGQENIIAALEAYETLTADQQEAAGDEIKKLVAECNAFLQSKSDEVTDRLDALGKEYHDSCYISGDNRLGREDKGWEEERGEIESAMHEVLETLASPLIERNHSLSNSFINSKAGDVSVYDIDIGFRFDDDDKEVSEEVSEEEEEEEEEELVTPPGSPWDLTKSAEYLERMRDLLVYTKEKRDDIVRETKILLTHLIQHDTLEKVRDERVAASIPSASTQSTSGLPLVATTLIQSNSAV